LAAAAAWSPCGAALRAEALAACGEALARHPQRALLYAPAALLRRAGHAPRLAHDRKVKANVVTLYGRAGADERYLVHQAQKCAQAALALLFGAAVAALARAGPEPVGLGAVLACAAFALPDSRLEQAIRKRNVEIMLDFPEFLVKLTLLVNAGMSVTRAWAKVAEDAGRGRALGRELGMSLLEIQAGKSEAKAYEDFAKRCRLPEVTRVVSMLLQNLRKGNAELVPILRVHANECWEMRKGAAKKLGEEASSKMLLPMAIMLAAILIVVTTPAMLALNKGF